ncbi:30S ribosome-binding factor RbfA [bacterium]|nr:30S ribosome-binding factor RbfA [bacterium]
MATIRQQRVQELLYQELSILISNELDDPRLSLLTVTNVVVSRDLRNAKIYVHHDDEEETPRRLLLRGLDRATPFIRRQLAQRLTLRVVPELSFHYDDTPERAARVAELLQRIRSERSDTDEAQSGEVQATPSPQTDADAPRNPED